MDINSIKEANKDFQSAEDVTLKDKDKEIGDFVSRRIQEMQDYRTSLKIEEKWRDADREYEPSSLDGVKNGKVQFETHEEDGLRSRLVPIGDGEDEWRSRISDPALLAKIQTAISIIIDQTPEGAFSPMGKQYEPATAIAKAAWKRNWNITNAKEVYKKFAFNLAKYGWAAGRSFPRIIQYEKEILTERDYKNPDNDKYEKTTNTWFNDVWKENLDPFRTWIDEQTKPYEDYSMNDCYYEKDFTYDAAKVEFGDYQNFDKYIKPNINLKSTHETPVESATETEDDLKTRKDIITIGCYENRLKDLYTIWIPKLKAPLYYSPHPNDDGFLSLWQTHWIMRSAENPYGISLWEIIKQNKGLYDKMKNMTMDQLVLSIMKMFFYTGTSSLLSDGRIKITPGKGHQIVNGKVDWMDIPGPGKDAFAGLQSLKNDMDDQSGITPTLQGGVTGETLGETLQAKEAALKRLKIPVDNIADAIEQDAYITISWTAQIKSTPEVKEFASLTDVMQYEKESGLNRSQLFGSVDPETSEPMGPFKATYLPEMSLALEKSGDKLIESRSERFFQVGKDFPVKNLYWRGIMKVEPKSIVSSSAELSKQNKMQLFNIIVPLLGQPAEIFGKSVQQIIKVNEEDPADWLPEQWLAFLDEQRQSLFVQNPAMMPPMNGAAGPGGQVPSNQTSMQGGAGTTPAAGAPTVVPQAQVPQPVIPSINAAPRQELTRSA